MGNASFWVVEGLLCLPLTLLVWAAQHVLNTLHPSALDRSGVPMLPRVVFLLVLLVMTCLMATCLFLTAAMSSPDWQQRWSDATLWLAFAEGWGLALSLVLVCANLARMVQARRRARCAHVDGSYSEQEDGR